MKDPRDPLSTTLQTWRHESAPAPDFESGVWSRIHTTTSSPSVKHTTGQSLVALRLSSAIRRLFPRALPLAASLAVLLAIAAGTTTAFAINRSQTADRMAAAYARSIDPVQMTAVHPAAIDSHAPHTTHP